MPERSKEATKKLWQCSPRRFLHGIISLIKTHYLGSDTKGLWTRRALADLLIEQPIYGRVYLWGLYLKRLGSLWPARACQAPAYPHGLRVL